MTLKGSYIPSLGELDANADDTQYTGICDTFGVMEKGLDYFSRVMRPRWGHQTYVRRSEIIIAP
jgi:hypothetical protein